MSSFKNSRQSALLPFFFALAIILGVFIGSRLNLPGGISFGGNGNSGKLNQLMQIIENDYVDEIDSDSLSDLAFEAVLSKLDPHSTYIPASDLQTVNDDMDGNFEGVGIEFNVLNDTISVVSVISGGPSDKAGILPGDRIISIDDEKSSGVKITNENIIKKLRGKRGTAVKVGIARKGTKKITEFEIIRDEIPIYSVDASFMLDKEIGYIKISRFAATTFDEYKKAMKKLQGDGIKKLILDLRGNPGGYLAQATDMADDFLKDDELIVYTEGKNRKQQKYYATSDGDWEEKPLVLLIDETSASASEILAGALQDQDRATIIGHRSFGKGLVQEQMDFADGSALRLTVARYYTPSGRSIQRPYTEGTDAYYQEMYDRMENMLEDEDSSVIIGDTVKYFTKNKRVVFGGGGIRPDIFIKSDSADYEPNLIALFKTGAINEFSFEFSDQNRENLKKTFANYKVFASNAQATEKIKSDFTKYLASSKETENIKLSASAIKRVKAFIGRNIWGNDAYYYILALEDKTIIAGENKLKSL